MTTLVSFLGRGRRTASGGQVAGYQSATYRVANGPPRTVPYVAIALLESLRPERLILLGTAGSMWDVFFMEQAQPDDEVLGLIDAVEREAVTAEMLEPHAARLGAQLGIAVDCVLIPYARTEAEQLAVLAQLSRRLQPGEHVSIDVTHSFRHLPMLSLVAARFLSGVRDVVIDDIHYGALEMRDADNVTPVLSLLGMLRMLDWVDALASYRKDGDYGVLPRLLEADGLSPAFCAQLAHAAFQERTLRTALARRLITGGVVDALRRHSGTMASLFRDELLRRIDWFRGDRRSQQELRLADAAIERSDWLRAVIFLHEAYLSNAVEQRSGDVNNHDDRETARQEARARHDDFRALTTLRNALAHGDRVQGTGRISEQVERSLDDETSFRAFVRRLRSRLFSV
jgi:CRISPR-associated Csx2 family protein